MKLVRFGQAGREKPGILDAQGQIRDLSGTPDWRFQPPPGFHRLMKPHDFLDLAEALALGDGEAEWRSAASRAYYAAFHVARLLLENAGFTVPVAEQAHAYLWLRLSNCGHPDVQMAGEDLKKMRGVRNEADYDLQRRFSRERASAQVSLASAVIQLLDSVTTLPAVQQRITDAIKV